MFRNGGFSDYLANVINPILRRSTDDGELAIWLNGQLDEWELEAERADGTPFAAQAVEHLNTLLAGLRVSIKEKIERAEAVLVGWAAA